MKDKKIVIAIIAFAVVLLLTVGATYAYFTASATSSGTQKQLNLKTANLGITYTHGNSVNFDNSNNLKEDWTGIIYFSVTNSGSVTQSFDILWDTITTNTIVGNADLTLQKECINNLTTETTPAACTTADVRDDFSYSLYKSLESLELYETENQEYGVETLPLNYSTANAEEYLYNKESDSIIYKDEYIFAGQTNYYMLEIRFNYNDSRLQNYQQGKEFLGNIKIDNVRMTSEVDEWELAQIGDTSNYMITRYTGGFVPSENVVINANGLTENDLLLLNGGDYKYFTDATDATSYEITVPSSYKGKTIKSIGTYALYGISAFINRDMIRLKRLTISDGIETIEGCSAPLLNTLSLGNTVTTIGEFAFQYTSLTGTINIPNSVVNMGERAFRVADGTNLTMNLVGRTRDPFKWNGGTEEEPQYNTDWTNGTVTCSGTTCLD